MPKQRRTCLYCGSVFVCVRPRDHCNDRCEHWAVHGTGQKCAVCDNEAMLRGLHYAPACSDRCSLERRRRKMGWCINDERVRLERQLRRIERMLAKPNTFNNHDRLFAIKYWSGKCSVCGELPAKCRNLVIDHWIAITDPECPGTIPGNMVPMCSPCNSSKGGKLALVWLEKKVIDSDRRIQIVAAIESFFEESIRNHQ